MNQYTGWELQFSSCESDSYYGLGVFHSTDEQWLSMTQGGPTQRKDALGRGAGHL